MMMVEKNRLYFSNFYLHFHSGKINCIIHGFVFRFRLFFFLPCILSIIGLLAETASIKLVTLDSYVLHMNQTESVRMIFMVVFA